MKYKEKESLPYNWKTDKYERKTATVDLFPYPIDGILYNIPPKIFNKPFVFEAIHLFYRSDEDKVLLTRELDDFPKVLKLLPKRYIPLCFLLPRILLKQ